MTYEGIARRLRGRLWIGQVVGVSVWITWCLSMALGPGAWRDHEGSLISADHIAFYSAARLIREGRQDRIYDHEFIARYQATLVWYDWKTLIAYRNPPFYALLYLPTAGLSFVASMVAWQVVGLACLVLAIRLLRPEQPRRALVWALCFYPVFSVVGFGQNTFLSLLVFAAVYRLAADGRLFAAGLAAGLLWYKPQLLIGLFIWWGLMPVRYARCWAGVLVTGAALAAVSWLALPEASRAFVDSLGANVGYRGENMWNKQSPRAFWALILPLERPTSENEVNPVVLGLSAACALAGVGAAAWVARRTGGAVGAMFPLAVFLSLWASPHALIYEWALLVAAAVVLWERFPDRRGAWLTLFAVTWLALNTSTTVAKFQIDRHWPVVLQYSVPVLGAVGWLTARELARAGGQPVGSGGHGLTTADATGGTC
jgi:alpha-1,2-mannosyltransferase